jgi:hypothetical protein
LLGERPPTMSESLEALLAEIAAKGLQVSNLFQLGPPVRWRANLRGNTPEGAWVWNFGEGASPAEALREALVQAEGPGSLRPPVPSPLGPTSIEELGL